MDVEACAMSVRRNDVAINVARKGDIADHGTPGARWLA